MHFIKRVPLWDLQHFIHLWHGQGADESMNKDLFWEGQVPKSCSETKLKVSNTVAHQHPVMWALLLSVIVLETCRWTTVFAKGIWHLRFQHIQPISGPQFSGSDYCLSLSRKLIMASSCFWHNYEQLVSDCLNIIKLWCQNKYF